MHQLLIHEACGRLVPHAFALAGNGSLGGFGGVGINYYFCTLKSV